MQTQQHRIQEYAKPLRQVARFYPPPVAGTVRPWEVTVYSTTHEPDRWRAHRQAADRSYASRRLEVVRRDHDLASCYSPTFFIEAMLDGTPVGGAHMHLPNQLGPLPILEELVGHVDSRQLAALIRSLTAEGIVHCAGLWIDSQLRNNGLAGDLSRAFIPMIVAAQARWYIATSHQYILDAWCSLGWQPVPAFPPFPYPDERYQTCVILGDVCRWPADLRAWAQQQAAGATLNGAGPRLTIQPMRVKEDALRTLKKVAASGTLDI